MNANPAAPDTDYQDEQAIYEAYLTSLAPGERVKSIEEVRDDVKQLDYENSMDALRVANGQLRQYLDGRLDDLPPRLADSPWITDTTTGKLDEHLPTY